MKQILLSPPHLAGNENEYIQQVLDSNWIAPVGKMLDAFEQSVCDYTGAKYALATNSGTSAIHLGLRLLGVGEGDYVICPTLTFIATANPALYLGANLIFVDCDETGNISPAYLEKALAYCAQTGKRVKVVIIVHLYGHNAQISELLAITQKYGVAVLEDAAEALGSTYEGKALGTFGDVGVLSFNGNKIITTSGGGMLLLPTAEMREKALFWATQAKDSAPHYQHSEIGYNYRLSNVLAGIGVAQMQVLPTRLQQKRAIFEKWVEGWRGRGVEGLKGKGNISFLNPMMPPFPPFHPCTLPPLHPSTLPPFHPSTPNYWLTVALFENYEIRERVRLALQQASIESRPVWKPLHLQPVFADVPYFGERVGEELFEKGLCLPSGTAMTAEELDYCIAEVGKAILPS